MKKQDYGITLVALVITIIILLILAGITISQLTGSGLFENARLAQEKSKNAQEKEDGILRDYENQMGEYINSNRNDNKPISQLTGIKTDIFVNGQYSNTGTFSEKTTMNSFTNTTDSENKISEYLSYSAESGYKVLKSGWYYVSFSVKITSSGTATDGSIALVYNGSKIADCYAREEGASNVQRPKENVTIYLSQGDTIYFSASGNQTAQGRDFSARVNPMF